MNSRLFRIFLPRYVHTKTYAPELDFTKPMSDRLRKTSTKEQKHSHDHERQSLLKIALRGQCLFGLYPIELALKQKQRQFYRLFLSKTSDEKRPTLQNIRTLAEKLSIPITYTNTDTLDRLAFDRPHQGVCLDCSPLPMIDIQQTEISEHDPNKIIFDLCLVKIHDPMNLGAIIRTSYFFGIDRIILTRGSCQPSPVASKASSGALELMPIYTCNDDLIAYLKILCDQKDVALVCASHKGKVSLQTLCLNKFTSDFSTSRLRRIILLTGNEHEGIPEQISEMCHYNVCIQPNIQSEVSSLNASVACALFLYHISAQIKM